MNKIIYDHSILGRSITSCAVVKKNVLVFFSSPNNYDDLPEDNEIPEQLFLWVVDNDSDNPDDFYYSNSNLSRIKLAVGVCNNELEIMGIEQGSGVFVYRDSFAGLEDSFPRDKVSTMSNIRYIGEHFYAAGDNRVVYRREGPNHWTYLSETAEAEDTWNRESRTGFNDIDGFSEQDIYAVGGRGHAWHYDGVSWSRMDLPVNNNLYSVCCASDGYVYIGGVGHTILRGRGDAWEIVNREEVNDRFEQLIEYNNVIYGVDEWGNTLYTITAKGIQPTEMGGYRFLSGGCLSLSKGDGILLAAGLNSASMFDGKQWVSLFEPTGYRQQLQEVQVLERVIDKMDESLDNYYNQLDDET